VARATVIAVLALGLAACARVTSSHPPLRIEFGIAGGNIAPFTVRISPTGAVRSSGSVSLGRTQLSGPARSRLKYEVINLLRLGRLRSKQCPGTLPDIAAQFLRAGGQTIRVHGSCEPRFTQFWNRLAAAVGLRR
jgi:hypothetical protein